MGLTVAGLRPAGERPKASERASGFKKEEEQERNREGARRKKKSVKSF